MGIMYLLFVFNLIFIRFLAGYDSRFQKGKYIEIKSNTLRKLLIDEDSFFERRKRSKKDIGKMTVSGLVFYISAFAVLVINIVLLIVPQIPTEPWEIETDRLYIRADTLNEKLSVISIWLLLLSVVGHTAIRLLKQGGTFEQRWLKVIIYITAAFMLVVVALIGFEMIKELIFCFV